MFALMHVNKPERNHINDLGSWRHRTMAGIDVDLSSSGLFGTHLKPISQEVPQLSMR